MTTYALIGLIAALSVLAALWSMQIAREPKPAGRVYKPKPVGRHRIRPDSPADATAWLHAISHDAPAVPFSPAEAHLAMQQHRECPASICERKAAAFDTLTGIGAIKPRTR